MNYSRVQLLAEKDMRQVATFITENGLDELEARPPPPLKEGIQNLYGDLWGRRKETSFPPNWGLVVDHSLTGVVAIPPIQLGGVETRHMKF
ncbi:hypothetical protein JTB14_038103 [Gonioctena quinquepunctata]|nr:hypothetical protein JTB14_038103 [Gonioctena quinquepunctata]